MRIYAQHMTALDISMLEHVVNKDKRLTLSEALKDIYTGKSALFRQNKTIYTLQDIDDRIHVAQLSGWMGDIVDIRHHVEQLARSMGKKYIDIDGRKGWARVLKPFGY